MKQKSVHVTACHVTQTARHQGVWRAPAGAYKMSLVPLRQSVVKFSHEVLVVVGWEEAGEGTC